MALTHESEQSQPSQIVNTDTEKKPDNVTTQELSIATGFILFVDNKGNIVRTIPIAKPSEVTINIKPASDRAPTNNDCFAEGIYI